MANRSDFYSAKLPRYYKRMLTMMSHNMTSHEYGEVRRAFISAHATHVGFKQKRLTQDVGAESDQTQQS